VWSYFLHTLRGRTQYDIIIILICISATAAEINGTCAAETVSKEHVRATVGNTESAAAAAKPLQKARGSTRSPPQTTTTNAERRRPLSLTQIRRRRRRRRRRAALSLIYQRRIIAAAAAARSLFIRPTRQRFLFTAASPPFFFLIMLCIQGDLSGPGAQLNRQNRAASGKITKIPVDLADEGCCRMFLYIVILFNCSRVQL